LAWSNIKLTNGNGVLGSVSFSGFIQRIYESQE
jgi:hypothetical protein